MRKLTKKVKTGVKKIFNFGHKNSNFGPFTVIFGYFWSFFRVSQGHDQRKWGQNSLSIAAVEFLWGVVYSHFCVKPKLGEAS